MPLFRKIINTAFLTLTPLLYLIPKLVALWQTPGRWQSGASWQYQMLLNLMLWALYFITLKLIIDSLRKCDYDNHYFRRLFYYICRLFYTAVVAIVFLYYILPALLKQPADVFVKDLPAIVTLMIALTYLIGLIIFLIGYFKHKVE